MDNNKGVDNTMYVNTLISLQENISTYGIDGKKVTGHVTITTPGIIKCYVQNLKQGDLRPFIFYAFSSEQNKGVRIGQVGTSKETKWVIDEKDVKGSGITAAQIDGIALVKEGEGMRGTDTVLVGYKNNRYMLIPILETIIPQGKSMTMNSGKGSENTQGGPGPVIVSKTPNNVPAPSVSMPQGPGPVIVSKNPNNVPTPPVIIPEEPGPVIIPECPDNSSHFPVNILEGSEAVTTSEDSNNKSQSDKKIPSQPCNCLGKEEIKEMSSTKQREQEELNSTQIKDEASELKKIVESIANRQKERRGSGGIEEQINKIREMTETSQEELKSPIQKALEARYIRQQEIRGNAYIEETQIKERESFEEEIKFPEEESIEEIDYLQEIEKKLKDIQTRLKASNLLQGSTRKFEGKLQDEKREDSLPKALEVIYREGEQIEGFVQEGEDIEWVKIPYSEFIKIPSLSYEWCTQPFITFSVYKYNEILLGKSVINDTYFVGIPDIYHPERKAILSTDKKVESFLCRRNTGPVIGEYGYWIIRV